MMNLGGLQVTPSARKIMLVLGVELSPYARADAPLSRTISAPSRA